MGVYDTYITDIAPTWLLNARSKSLLEGYGAVLDAEGLTRTKDSVKAGIIETAPNDALDPLGRDRLLERFPSETNANYRARLLEAWQIWSAAGTEAGILNVLERAYPGPSYSIIENKDWVVPPDGDTAYWSRAWLVIDQPHPWNVDIWNGGTWGDGGSWGSDMTLEEVALYRKLLRQFKPAEVVWISIYLMESGGFWGDGGVWGDGGFWGGVLIEIGDI